MLNSKLASEVQKRDNYVCQYCGKDGLESLENWHHTVVDHFDPKKGDVEDNLVTSCEYCNAIKLNKVFDTMQEARDYIIGRRIQLFKDFLKVKREVRS